jgi:hypothetical protein
MDIFPSVSVASDEKDFWAIVDSIVYRSTDLGVSWDSIYTATDDKFTFASFATVGDTIAGWVTGLGENIYACRYPVIDVIETANREIPRRFELSQNYPNPFNPTTTIKFQIPNSQFVTLEMYNLLGQKVAVLVNENLNAGLHTTEWNAADLASGVYLYRLQAGNYIETKKLILLR